MAITAQDLQKNAADTTDAGFNLFTEDITSPSAGACAITKIYVGAAGTATLMDVSNPIFSQLTTGTASIGTVALSATDNAVLDAIAASVAGTLIVGSHAVTNAGTFVVQAALDAETTKVIGTVNIAAAQTIAVTNAGTFATQATLQAETTKVIGTVNVAAAQTIAATNAGTFAVQVDGDALTALQLIDNAVSGAGFNVTQLGGVNVSLGTGVRDTGTQRVTIATNDSVPVTFTGSTDVATQTTLAALNAKFVTGTDIGDVDVLGIAAGSSTNAAVATNGATPGKLVSAATTNATSVKASAGTLYSVSVGSVNAAVRYLKFYNKASAPTVGTDTPVQIFSIPGNTAGAGREVQIPVCGIEFSTGIAFALTTGAADADTGAVAASEIVVSYSYK